jgi:hypothetical protein
VLDSSRGSNTRKAHLELEATAGGRFDSGSTFCLRPKAPNGSNERNRRKLNELEFLIRTILLGKVDRKDSFLFEASLHESCDNHYFQHPPARRSARASELLSSLLSRMNTTKSFCNRCVGECNHAILHSETESGRENDSYQWSVENETLKCQGCDTVSLRRTTWESPVIDENGSPLLSVAHYPPSMFRREPTWILELKLRITFNDDKTFIFDDDNAFITDLMHEIYICIQNDCRRSATMAVRALLEQVMIYKVGDQQSFAKNIAKFREDGYISTIQKEFLETVIDAGHATIHRAYKPSKEDLIALVNIAESVIEAVYINEHRAARLKKRIPSKKTKLP